MAVRDSHGFNASASTLDRFGFLTRGAHAFKESKDAGAAALGKGVVIGKGWRRTSAAESEAAMTSGSSGGSIAMAWQKRPGEMVGR